MGIGGKTMKILIIDDEKGIRSIIREYCENSHYEVDEASSGKEALEKIMNNDYDLMVLDIMMPEMDGFTMLKECPKSKKIPTIILSARSEEYDKLSGFDLGIDDYMTKPFSPKELVARIKAVINRTSKKIKESYTYKTLSINIAYHTVKIGDKIINLTPKEFDILVYLVNNKNIAITREQLLSNVWGYDYFGDDRTVDTHIKMLRNNLGIYRDNIQTVRGIGYKYVENEE